MLLTVNKFYEPEQKTLITDELLNNDEFVNITRKIDEYGYKFELTIRPIKKYAKPNLVFHPYEMLLVSKDESYYVTICASISIEGIRKMIIDLFKPMKKDEFNMFIDLTKRNDKGVLS